MRKYLTLALAGILTLVMANVAIAQEPQQTLETKLTPTKADKKKFKPAKIFVNIETGDNDQAEPNSAFDNQPPSAFNTKVDFPKNMKFDTRAVPNCKVSEAELENSTTESARELCGNKSVVSLKKGTGAEVTIDTSPTSDGGSFPVEVVVTAFNGKAKNQVFLHSRADLVNNTSILVGKLKKARAPYGKTLDVRIPELDAGAISEFRTTVKAGKYVQTRCKSKTNKFRARTRYENHTPTTATDQSKCKRSKKRN